MDSVTKEKRSSIMSKIKSKETVLEINFGKSLWKKGLRYRKNSSKYLGKPDILLKKYKVVIFIDSCFWHGCSKHCRMPNSRNEYWINKINNNKRRDKEVTKYYKKIGWKIFRVWEHEIKENEEKIIKKICDYVKSLD